MPGLDDFVRFPFFIRYADEDWQESNYDTAASPANPGAISRLIVGGDKQQMISWLGSESLPLSFIDGPPGLHAVVIESPSGEIVIRNEDLAPSAMGSR